MHTLLDVRGSIPTTVSVSDGRTHEANWLDQLAFESNAIYIMDRGYLDFGRLHTISQAQAFFVIRARERPTIAGCIRIRWPRPPDCAAIKPSR